MPSARVDPYDNFNFQVQINDIVVASFSEVCGLTVEVDVVEYREGTDVPLSVRKLPGLIHYSDIVLKRGITRDMSLWNWINSVLQGTVQRASGAIVLQDAAHNDVLRWNFVNGWPRKWEGPHLGAKTSEVAIETLEIAHEGLVLAA
jgi:phage tail-like protein